MRITQLKRLVVSFGFITRSLSMLTASRGDGLGGKGIVLMPKAGTYSKVVLWYDATVTLS